MIANRIRNQNTLLGLDSTRAYPMTKINKKNTSNLYLMAYGERDRSPRKEHQDFLASIIKRDAATKSGLAVDSDLIE